MNLGELHLGALPQWPFPVRILESLQPARGRHGVRTERKMGLKRDTLMCGERRRDGGFQSDKASLGQKNGVGSIGVGSIAERGAASDGARQPGNRGLGAREMEGTGNKAWGEDPKE